MSNELTQATRGNPRAITVTSLIGYGLLQLLIGIAIVAIFTAIQGTSSSLSYGKDTLYGNVGADALYGGSGDDQLYASAGNTTMVGGRGIDTFIFSSLPESDNEHVTEHFKTTERDALDISSLLDRFYDPLVDMLAEFVQITDNRSSSTLSIDQDGGGDQYVPVATIYGETNLTKDDSLEESGRLITG